jgi:predicted N-formylglutamate amidohydrolase
MLPLIFSCEHATCFIPEAFKDSLKNDMELITSPLGWDLGSLNLAQAFSMKFRIQLIYVEISRLLIDCYLHEKEESRWSDLSAKLSENQREKLHERQYALLMTGLKQRINTILERNPQAVHISIHTFCPKLTQQNCDISLLFSEAREPESTYARHWIENLKNLNSELRITENGSFYPTRKETILDNLREQYSADQYLGIELQVSQSFFLEGKPMKWEAVKKLLFDSMPPPALLI